MGENFVTREELNGSILRLETRVVETNTLIREQNAQFSQLLEREVDKREECDEKLHERISAAAKGKVSYVVAVLITVLTSTVVGLAVAVFSRAIR